MIWIWASITPGFLKIPFLKKILLSITFIYAVYYFIECFLSIEFREIAWYALSKNGWPVRLYLCVITDIQ